jgi:hypothetical protein
MPEEKLTPWQQYKKNLGTTRPWDIINPKTEYVKEDVSDQRFEICKTCPELISLTKQCKKCGCHMPTKTKMLHAVCPLNKW